jgi:hypothetical protein
VTVNLIVDWLISCDLLDRVSARGLSGCLPVGMPVNDTPAVGLMTKNHSYAQILRCHLGSIRRAKSEMLDPRHIVKLGVTVVTVWSIVTVPSLYWELAQSCLELTSSQP